MAFDLRQGIGAVLTLSMFLMLGNMIKKEHFDPYLDNSGLQTVGIKTYRQYRVKLSSVRNGPWMKDLHPPKPCWKILSHDAKQETEGHVLFSLTHGPEYHAFQVGMGIMVARKLGAALVIPDVRSNKGMKKRLFGELYDTDQFIRSLEGIIPVVKDPPSQQSGQKIITVRLSYRISEELITTRIEPLFRKRKQVRVAFSLKPSKTHKANESNYFNPYTCLAMFGSLKLKPDLQGLLDSIVGTLRNWSPRSFGKFAAMDLRSGEFGNKSFPTNATSKRTFNDASEIGQFLKRIGFERHTTLYLTQVGLQDEVLPALRQHFPNTFTKEAILPMDIKAKYLNTEDQAFQKLVDFYICTQSDVFVPGFHDQFESNIIGMRIAKGKTQIFAPAERTSKFPADFVPTYITKKSHIAYSCFC